MKVEAKTRKDYGSQQYKFRSRAFQMESIIEVDMSTLGKSVGDDSFSEWKELLSEEEFTTTVVLLLMLCVLQVVALFFFLGENYYVFSTLNF